MQPILRLVAVLSLAAAVAACSKVTPENYERIRDGMTVDEVIGILGKPAETSSIAILGITGTSCTWAGGEHTILVQFVDGKVRIKSLGQAAAQ